MELLSDPQAWLAFFSLSALEIILGFDNLIFLAILVDRLPSARRPSARILGLTFAMVTRIALLLSVTWLARLRTPWVHLAGRAFTGRDLVLFAGGFFLMVQSVQEIRETLHGEEPSGARGFLNGFWAIIVQIGLIDILFSLDSVFTAIGLANDVAVMIAAIVVSVVAMMFVAPVVSGFVARHPTVKVLALAFLVLVGAELILEAFDVEVPKGYLYCAMGFAALVEGLNSRLRRRGPP